MVFSFKATNTFTFYKGLYLYWQFGFDVLCRVNRELDL